MIKSDKSLNKIIGYTLIIAGSCVLLGIIGLEFKKWYDSRN